MRKKRSELLSVAILCLVFLAGIGKLSSQNPVFTAGASSDKVVQNSVFTVQFELRNAAGESFQPPSFENFKIVGGPSTSSSTMIMNGQVSRSQSWSYSLLAVQEGKFTIGSAKVAAGRKVLSTSPLTIEVVKARNPSESGITTGGKERVILVADLDASAYYPGQQIMLRYKLLFNENIQSVTALSEDDYADFFIQTFNTINQQSTQENVNGEPFTSRVIKAIALFAHQSGDYTIDPMILDAGIEAPFPEKRGFFTMRGIETVKVASAPKKIHIVPLPGGAPATFSGAVGQYSVKLISGSTEITTDDAFTLQVEIKGNGDSRRWDPPSPVVDGDFEIYDPRIVEDKMLDEEKQITHLRIIEYQMIPRQPGQYKVVLPLTYFNPLSRKYETTDSDTIRLQVTQGTNKERPSIAADEKELPGQLRNIRNISTDDRFWLSIPHLLLFGFILTGSFWGVWVSYKKGREDQIPLSEKIRAAAVGHARLQLQTLESSSQNISSKEFFERAIEIYYKFLSDKLSIPPAELDQHKLPQYLEQKGISNAIREEVVRFFSQSLSVRYGGIPGGMTKDEALAQIRHIIDAMEK